MTKLPEHEIRNFIFYLDGLKHSLEMLYLIFSRLEKNLANIVSCYEKQDNGGKLSVGALLDAWSFIDVVHRIRELIQQTPQMSKRASAIQIFLRSTSQIEDLRHYIQHLRTAIPKLPIESNPLWGSLSWVPPNDQTKCYSIFPGSSFVVGTGKISASSCVYDQVEKRFIQDLILEAFGKVVDLKKVYTYICELESYIEEWVKNNTTISYKEIHPAVLSFVFKQKT